MVAAQGRTESDTSKRLSSSSPQGKLQISGLSFQGRLPAVWAPGEGPAHCVTGDAITQGRGGAAASFLNTPLSLVKERERKETGGECVLFRGGRGVQSERRPRGVSKAAS